MLGHGLHLDRVAKVGLVRAIPADRVAESDVREFLGHRLSLPKFLEDAAQHGLHRVEHIVLGGEAHFDIELVEFAG